MDSRWHGVVMYPDYADFRKYPHLAELLSTAAVENLGVLPHRRVLELERDSFAVVFPTGWQENFPATFTEPTAFGTPVLTEAVPGSPTEELLTPEQVLPAGARMEDYVQKLASWAARGGAGRPTVALRSWPNDAISRRWVDLLRS